MRVNRENPRSRKRLLLIVSLIVVVVACAVAVTLVVLNGQREREETRAEYQTSVSAYRAAWENFQGDVEALGSLVEATPESAVAEAAQLEAAREALGKAEQLEERSMRDMDSLGDAEQMREELRSLHEAREAVDAAAARLREENERLVSAVAETEAVRKKEAEAAQKRAAEAEAEQQQAAAQGSGAVPSSCEELYSPAVRDALQAQGFVPTSGGRSGYPEVLTMDTPANQIAADRLAFQCGLAVEGAGGEALQTQVSIGLTPEERDHVVGVLAGEGLGCSALSGGTWCSSGGVSHFLRDGFWMATKWTYAPDGYTPLIAGAIWGE